MTAAQLPEGSGRTVADRIEDLIHFGEQPDGSLSIEAGPSFEHIRRRSPLITGSFRQSIPSEPVHISKSLDKLAEHIQFRGDIFLKSEDWQPMRFGPLRVVDLPDGKQFPDAGRGWPERFHLFRRSRT